jgi:Ulp1 family protease
MEALQTAGEYIPGDIIDFYLESWVSTQEESERMQYHIFPTTLLAYLQTCKNTGRTAGGAAYKNSLNFSRHDFLLFPIHEMRDGSGHHWYLVIFCMFPTLSVESDQTRRCVLFFNSLKCSRTRWHAKRAIADIKAYLTDLGGSGDSPMKDFPFVEVEVHQQDANNCAVNTIKNATNFLEGVDNASNAGLQSYAEAAKPCKGEAWKVPEDIRDIISERIMGACAWMCACACACVRVCVRADALARVRGHVRPDTAAANSPFGHFPPSRNMPETAASSTW